MQCPYCSQQHPDNAQFCPVTGQQLTVTALRNRPRTSYFALGIFSAVLVMFSLWMLISTNSDPFQRVIDNAIDLPIANPTETKPVRPFPTSTPLRKTSTPRPTMTSEPTSTRAVNSDAYNSFDWSTCHAIYRTRVKPGDTVEIANSYPAFGYHVLSGPYADREPVGDVSPGERVLIINGPSCSNRWIWWLIYVEGAEISGWFAEGDSNTFWLLPVSDDLDAGQARISREVGKVNLRRTPGYKSKDDTDVIVEIPSGEILNLLGGPQFVEGLNWWYVEWNGYKGWMAERTMSGKTILVFDP